MDEKSSRADNVSAETILLLRVWYESDNSPRYLLETVHATPNRRLFTRLSDLTDWLAVALTDHRQLIINPMQKGELNES